MTEKQNREVTANIFSFPKQYKRWDNVPVSKVSIADLSNQAFEHFRKCALASKRLPKEEMIVTDEELLKKLRLMERRYLKRAALLFFHPDPEKFATGAYIKIGFGGKGDNLLFQKIHGNLFEQGDRAIDLILTKYMTHSFPARAIWEVILNALTHKDYSCRKPIEINVYDDRICIWNKGKLPESWTVQRLYDIHPALPYNPDIASTFFWAGYVESWGTGILKIRTECSRVGLPEPEFKYDANGLMVMFKGLDIVL